MVNAKGRAKNPIMITKKLNSLSIFFPCYNDSGTIGRLVVLANHIAPEVSEDYEIIVVDDGCAVSNE